MLDSEMDGQDLMQYDSEDEIATATKQQFAPMMSHLHASN